MAGHVSVGDNVFISGTCLIHQHVKIGRLSFVGPFGGTRQDVPPFALCEGRPLVTLVGLNKVGLRRAGMGAEARNRLKRAYHTLFFSHLNTSQAIETVRETLSEDAADAPVAELLDFMAASKRGIRRADAQTQDVHDVMTLTERLEV